MRKKRGKKKMAMANHITLQPELVKKKRELVRRTNKMANMTKTDLREWNEVSKRSRGFSKLTLNDVFGDGK